LEIDGLWFLEQCFYNMKNEYGTIFILFSFPHIMLHRLAQICSSSSSSPPPSSLA
jgi:hypothetical protein